MWVNRNEWCVVVMMLPMALWACDGGRALGVDSGPLEPDSGSDAGAEDSSHDAGLVDDGGTSIVCLSPGIHRDQTYKSGEETRYYLLHVPTGHRCGEPLAMWFDFHGTAGDHPEEAYGLDAMISIADREHVLVVRPRSRPFETEGVGVVYQWDRSPGDIERNLEYIEALARELTIAYSVDRTRIIASGFSSGSNMAAQLLADANAPFTAYGFVAGGAFTPIRLPTLEASPPRIYTATGYRDYLRDTHDRLMAAVVRAGIPSSHVFERESDGGHDLYDWHFEEMWRFFVTGERENEGELSGAYTRIETATNDSLLEVTIAPDGALLVASEGPSVLRREGDVLTRIRTPASSPSWTGICVTDAGVAVAVGGGHFTRSLDHGRTWSAVSRIPDFGTAMFGYSFMIGVGCGSADVLAAGYWAGASSIDGREWSAVPIIVEDSGFRWAAQNAAVGRGTNGTNIVVGYYQFIGRRSGEEDFIPIPNESLSDWYFDVDEAAPGTWVVVGDRGTVLRSVDDGFSFEEVASGTDADLYAVDMLPVGEGIAVGLHGTAIRTIDGGNTWTDISPGILGFLGGVQMIGPGHAVLVGESGWMLEYRAE